MTNPNLTENEFTADLGLDRGSHSITGLIHTSPEYIGTEENKYVESYVLEALSIKSSGFVDLHVRKKEGVSWLKKVTKQYKKK
jgi:hypothetical protein